jgi:type I restriction enzyme S subunit
MSSGEIHNGQIFVTEKKITPLGYDKSSTKMVPANSVIVALAGQGKTRGSVAITRISLCTNQSLCSILPNETYDSDYLYFFLKNQYETLRFISSGDGTRGGLNLQMLRDFLIPVPSLEEQQKIAECLSSIESYISSINEKVEQLKAHKKSLMQKLFPQNGKNVPEYRFSEFNNTKEWEIKKVGDIATTFSGGTPSISKKQYYGGDIPFIRSGEIKGTKTELSLTQLGVEKTSAKLVSAGTILYALYGATSGEVAISKISGAINQAILAIIVDNELCEVQFLYQILLANKEKILDKYLQGGQGNLSGSIITNLQILLPPLVEQSKIAECLSSIDRAIECYSQKTILLEQHKKGLMQQLFLKS